MTNIQAKTFGNTYATRKQVNRKTKTKIYGEPQRLTAE